MWAASEGLGPALRILLRLAGGDGTDVSGDRRCLVLLRKVLAGYAVNRGQPGCGSRLLAVRVHRHRRRSAQLPGGSRTAAASSQSCRPGVCSPASHERLPRAPAPEHGRNVRDGSRRHRRRACHRGFLPSRSGHCPGARRTRPVISDTELAEFIRYPRPRNGVLSDRVRSGTAHPRDRRQPSRCSGRRRPQSIPGNPRNSP
jgi:hypothetical protein